ncbi:class I SAM-dependent DNA methyltransferase [Paralcaligenes sp. KSB-10]|uniref:class I SAM-dependent DNA methyltransferase n=1 Tax=Paralcaligenes sp. KSB-10 TaxID=2901142 RepID=UPI001E325F21|nr:DNA methyltransferase [Paralcaligenes sp. KSB-10]UHL62749.1 class I SAM-dependent DNA methyltransferase [Paralcaligenes sp. KSB-10]
MPSLTRNEVRRRLTAFSVQWKDAARENADAKLFWARFYECFGVRPESATIYEKAVDKIGGGHGFIDSFIPGLLIVEHKSRGKNLDAAFNQAADYFVALPEAERPRYIVTSDFARFRLYDLKTDQHSECTLKDLAKRAGWFNFLVEENAPEIVEESPINRQAAYVVSRFHEALLRANFKGRDLEVLLTRLLFCLFADDTGIFGADGQFRNLIEATRPDGRDTGARLAELFDVLNTAEVERQSTLDETLSAFAYINGNLFSERTRIPSFDTTLRKLLVECAELDWSGISPAIFGAMFQGVLEVHHPDETRQASRRELGAHYTSERNILRVINPLCMDDLRAEYQAAKHSKPRLKALYDKLPSLTFLDPACGCGNFLVIAYRELRRLENEIIADLFDFDRGRGLLDVSTLCRVRVTQFYGIEIDEAAAHISRVALWITDHQMNLEAAQRFGNTRPTVPLVDSPTIVCDNALRIDWAGVVAPERCSYVLGNPPFVGAKFMTDAQRADTRSVFAGIKNAGLLDLVAAWYIKAMHYIQVNPIIDVAFVSTNSIAQGEQVAVLWSPLLAAGIKIRFAHRTFKWGNEGKGNAAVHCVIIGFGLRAPPACTLFDYGNNIKEDGIAIAASRVNPYLLDAPDVLIPRRSAPICRVPHIQIGNKPIDNGNYLFTQSEKAVFIAKEPASAKWFRQWLGAEEFINGIERWCLWLGDCTPSELRAMPEALKRVQAVREFRLASDSPPTQKLANSPTRFHVEFLPDGPFMVLPSVSSERRQFVPMGFLPAEALASNLVLVIPNATLYHFAVLNSTLHNAWMRAVCGRLKSDYRYSNTIVYNNYPWPDALTDKQREGIEATGRAVLEARALYPDATLADLYDPLTMPTELHRAHQSVDRAVDSAYGYKGGKDDAARVAFLFVLYQRYTSLLPVAKVPKRRRVAGGHISVAP